jgi:hypothetical protein
VELLKTGKDGFHEIFFVSRDVALCAFKDGMVALYNVTRRQVEWCTEGGHTETIFDCAFKSDDPNILATASFDRWEPFYLSPPFAPSLFCGRYTFPLRPPLSVRVARFVVRNRFVYRNYMRFDATTPNLNVLDVLFALSPQSVANLCHKYTYISSESVVVHAKV